MRSSHGSSSPSRGPGGRKSRTSRCLASRTRANRSRRSSARCSWRAPRRHRIWRRTPAGSSSGSLSSPEIAAGQHVDERHDREDEKDAPGELLTAAQVVAAGEVDPAEHDGYRVNEADEDFEKLLHGGGAYRLSSLRYLTTGSAV